MRVLNPMSKRLLEISTGVRGKIGQFKIGSGPDDKKIARNFDRGSRQNRAIQNRVGAG